MDSLGRIVAAFLLFVHFLLLRCQAQSIHGFNWAFDFQSLNIQECQTSTVQLKPLNTSSSFVGIPPYYMLALEVAGISSKTFIGNDSTQLSWQNTHHQGAQLLLTVVDSTGSTAGFPSHFYSVIGASPGSDTSCLAPGPTSSTPRITPNVTSSLETCEPWGLTITGGVKPYNITFGQIASGVITEEQMGPVDDVYTYINRADPNLPLMAAVTDATGQWGVSTVAVDTTGSSDTTCGSLVSVSGTTLQVKAQAAAASAAAHSAAGKADTTRIALGITFGLVVPLLAGGLFGLWWWRRRKRQLSQRGVRGQVARSPQEDTERQQHVVRPSLNLDMSQVANVVRVNSQQQRTASWAVDTQSSASSTRQADRGSPTLTDMTSTELHQALPTPYLTSPTLPPAPTFIKSPLTRSPQTPQELITLATPNSTSPAVRLSPEARYRKALEALAEAQANRARLQGQTASSPLRSRTSPVAGPSSSFAAARRPPVQRSRSAGVAQPFPVRPSPIARRAGASLRVPSVAAIGDDTGPDIIIQHRDGGIVEELPPPYIDRYPRGQEQTGPSTPRMS
ncbi:hypothetical protein ACG7TL_008076 [Trametes sanguinea]